MRELHDSEEKNWSARRSWINLPLWGDVQHVKKKGMSSHFTYQYQHPTVAGSEILHASPVMYENPTFKKKTARILQTSTGFLAGFLNHQTLPSCLASAPNFCVEKTPEA